MGFFYKNDGGNRTVGFKFSIKFGKGNHEKEDSVAKWPTYVLELLEKLGLTVESDSDNDPDKDRRIL